MSDRHPVVGSWRVSVEIPGAPSETINLATLSLDGGVLVVFPSPTPAPPGASHRFEFWTPAIGRWAPKDGQSATMSFVALGVDENGTGIGTHAVTATVTADAGGGSWNGPFTIVITGPDGTRIAAISGAVSATRISA